MIDQSVHGSLFSNDLLKYSIREFPEWNDHDDVTIKSLYDAVQKLFLDIPAESSPNESQTENDLIWPVLNMLGWNNVLREQNLTVRGREDVPDGVLFPDADSKVRANQLAEEWRRYQFGAVIVEAKRWGRPLDRRSGQQGEETAPSTQMLRYLRRVDDLTNGGVRWGILTNGRRWRLYYAGARSVSEQFLDIDLAAILNISGYNDGLFQLNTDTRSFAFKLFVLFFERDSFMPSGPTQRTLHQRALDEGRYYEERVAGNLSGLVFEQVKKISSAILDQSPDSSLQEVRDSALIFLYRVLFILYAEDRELLPVNDNRYDDYALRDRVRLDVGERKDRHNTFSTTAARYWAAIDDLSRAIDLGDPSVGLPPYNGGLFDRTATPLLNQVRLSDAVIADVIDALSFERTSHGRRYINYRDLSVQQLGSIYERLLEYELVRDGDDLAIRPNRFARKDSGSFYTPESLVGVIISETVGPLISERKNKFSEELKHQEERNVSEETRLARLQRFDPAEQILGLKICDPAMGSGHFLVSLVDFLADEIISAMADVEADAYWAEYRSPLADRIDSVRSKILQNADAHGWSVDPKYLDDRQIVRRMILKRCIYGVDKNPMAVELAKVTLWLHTFTVGAPLSFLDHHLRCGDSLFGTWVREGIDYAHSFGAPLLLHGPMRRALRAASGMSVIESLTDVEIAEAHRSADLYREIREMTDPLSALLSVIHALIWLRPRERVEQEALRRFFDGQFGDPVEIAAGTRAPDTDRPDGETFGNLFERIRELVLEQRFLHWQVAFPGVWRNWESKELEGGFDAVIGNPPWDRIKLEQVEWFALRRREIAMCERAADRKRRIAALREEGDPLWREFERAEDRAEQAASAARRSGDYRFLAHGDANLYGLFVERAMTLVKPDGMVGMLTPSGIASDRNAARFFQKIATEGRLKALYDFENKKVFFPDVHASFKFCVFIAGRKETSEAAKCAFYLHSVTQIHNEERCFPLRAEDFARVNPNTGTAPVFRSRKDADLTTFIYSRNSVLVDRSKGTRRSLWPTRYVRMFDMTNDSNFFRTRYELETQEGAYRIGLNRYQSGAGTWVPLYEGKMVQAFDHRAASITVNPNNQHRPAQTCPATLAQHADPAWLPEPRFWVREADLEWPHVDLPSDGERVEQRWTIALKDVTATTNVRTIIAAIVPKVGCGNTLPLLQPELPDFNAQRDEEIFELDVKSWFAGFADDAPLLLANLNSVVLDFIARQKVQGQHLNWYILEQLPVLPPSSYWNTYFGDQSAAYLITKAVLELTYTANDMAEFAMEMGFLDEKGRVKAPFVWDENRRLRLRARLDAIFFHLYGITSRSDITHIYSTFPIFERQEQAEYDRFLSRDLCLAYVNALAAGHPDAEPVV